VLLIVSGLIYYPKWNKVRTEATISWDVSGYYFYLPAIFIYNDLKRLDWHDEISRGYDPGPGYQAFEHPGGNKVMKYSAGLAIQYLPFFLIAHWLAPLTGNPADGFSAPYQLAISLGSLLIACLGLWLLRLVLRRYFPDGVTALVLITIAFATNYLDYAGINSAMSHNYLFTGYALLLWLSDNYWKRPTSATALCIGLLIGLMALTRPTEIVSILIPLLWGVRGEKSMQERVRAFRQNWSHFVIAAGACLLIGAVQIIYWKYISGSLIVYSYEEQGFSWLSPHVLDGMFSYRAGWLVYTPVMLLSLTGFYFLYRRNPGIFHATVILSGVFMYLTWAWDVWWYGGSLGQRAMVQLYPVLAFPLAASTEWFLASKLKSPLACQFYQSVFITISGSRIRRTKEVW
jgi:hypothetical protein